MPSRLPPYAVLPWLCALLLLAGLFGLASGPAPLAWQLLWNGDAAAELILWQLRAPRVLLAGLIGAALALSGAAMQGLCRNPLADPSIIGVTSGASLGASLVIALSGLIGLGGALAGLSLLVGGAFAGGLLASLLVYRLASTPQGVSVLSMLLAGLAIGALAGAINSGLAYLVDNEALRRISLWQMGSLGGANWTRVAVAAVLVGPALLWLPRDAPALNALLLGESEARHLGVDVTALKRRLILLVALAVAAAVALGGVIAFVGLLVPHLLRLWLGPDHRLLLPATALAGAALLILADALSRVLLAPAELPIGILTALLGAPLFLSLLRQRRLYLPA